MDERLRGSSPPRRPRIVVCDQVPYAFPRVQLDALLRELIRHRGLDRPVEVLPGFLREIPGEDHELGGDLAIGDCSGVLLEDPEALWNQLSRPRYRIRPGEKLQNLHLALREEDGRVVPPRLYAANLQLPRPVRSEVPVEHGDSRLDPRGEEDDPLVDPLEGNLEARLYFDFFS